MRMYEVEFSCAGKYFREQMTEKEIEEYKNCEFINDLGVIGDLGEKNERWIDTWLKIGMKNYWISRAYDPEFTRRSFSECKTLDYLMDMLEEGNWCLGQAFYFEDICFINQVSGGDEWMVIRRDLDFESMNCGRVIERGRDNFIDFIRRVQVATNEELENLNY